MSLNLREGERLLLPCRTCATLCVPFSVTPGAFQIPCPRCGLESDVACEAREDGWAIRVLADGRLVAIWE